MKDIKEELFTDILQSAIESERKCIIYEKIIFALLLLIVALIGGILWIVI